MKQELRATRCASRGKRDELRRKLARITAWEEEGRTNRWGFAHLAEKTVRELKKECGVV